MYIGLAFTETEYSEWQKEKGAGRVLWALTTGFNCLLFLQIALTLWLLSLFNPNVEYLSSNNTPQGLAANVAVPDGTKQTGQTGLCLLWNTG